MTAVRPDVDDVGKLCRLAVAARRVGCHIHLSEATAELWEIIELAGVGDVLARCPADTDRADDAPPEET